MEKGRNKDVLRISNILNFTRQEFSMLEKHIYLLTILSLKEHQGFNLELNPAENIKIEFPATTLKETNRDRIKEALDRITSRKIHFDNSSKDNEYFGSVVLFYYARYESVAKSSSSIHISIAPECKKLFVELANGYTIMDLKAIISLKSNYSIRMYELMSQYLNQGSWTVSIEKLRGLFNLEHTNYKKYGMFEKRILLYSQRELWEHCNLHFEWEIAEKKGKKITALTFHIKERDKQERAELNEEIKYTQDFIKGLSPGDISQKANFVKEKYNLTGQQFDYIIGNNEVFNEFIRIDLIIEDMIAKGKPPRDRTKYLAKSLKLDKVKFPKAKSPKLFD